MYRVGLNIFKVVRISISERFWQCFGKPRHLDQRAEVVAENNHTFLTEAGLLALVVVQRVEGGHQKKSFGHGSSAPSCALGSRGVS